MKERYEPKYILQRREGVLAHTMKQDKGVKEVSSYLS